MRSLLVNDPRNAGTQWADFELDSFAAAHEYGIGPFAICHWLKRCLLSGVTRET
jgi:hypothetical protein